MEVKHRDDDLDRLETEARFNARLPQAVVRGYRKVMNLIRQAQDERDLRQFKGLHFEKLEGPRSHQHSMRLNLQYRLIVELTDTPRGRTIEIVEITDHYK